jgi:hypothetical protein
MSELSSQLLSTRIQQLAGEAAGHNNESAHYEITFDNPLDVNADKIILFICPSKLCWAILDNGPGIRNIENLWGTGEGLKVKTGDKIGNKIAGELAASTFFQADKTMYFSRCNENIHDRKHQQLNAQINKMIQLIRTYDIDMTMANDVMLRGTNKLVRKPEPDDDKFDTGNVETVKELFKNNEYINEYFDDNTHSGMLKVFKYEEENKEKFSSLLKDLPKILERVNFLTYNTVKAFRGNKQFTFMNVDTNFTKMINKDSCFENFILGRKSIIEDINEMNEHKYVFEDETFGNIDEQILYMSNNIYEKDRVIYSRTLIENYGEELFIGENIKKYLGNETSESSIYTEESIVGTIPIYLSFVDKTEAEEQALLMNDGSTLESMKQCFIYYNGRFLAKCKIPIIGVQERSLPHFRIALCLNEITARFVNIRANKSSVSLETSHPIIKRIFSEIVKPILNRFSSSKGSSSIIHNGIDDWDKHKNDVLRELGVPIVVTTLPQAPVVQIIPSTVTIQTPVINTVNTSSSLPITNTILSGLNKQQTAQHLRRLKSVLNSNSKYKSRGEKKKLLTKLNDIEREILIENDILDEKIDFIIELLSSQELNGNIKHATLLQHL